MTGGEAGMLSVGLLIGCFVAMAVFSVAAMLWLAEPRPSRARRKAIERAVSVGAMTVNEARQLLSASDVLAGHYTRPPAPRGYACFEAAGLGWKA